MKEKLGSWTPQEEDGTYKWLDEDAEQWFLENHFGPDGSKIDGTEACLETFKHQARQHLLGFWVHLPKEDSRSQLRVAKDSRQMPLPVNRHGIPQRAVTKVSSLHHGWHHWKIRFSDDELRKNFRNAKSCLECLLSEIRKVLYLINRILSAEPKAEADEVHVAEPGLTFEMPACLHTVACGECPAFCTSKNVKTVTGCSNLVVMASDENHSALLLSVDASVIKKNPTDKRIDTSHVRVEPKSRKALDLLREGKLKCAVVGERIPVAHLLKPVDNGLKLMKRKYPEQAVGLRDLQKWLKSCKDVKHAHGAMVDQGMETDEDGDAEVPKVAMASHEEVVKAAEPEQGASSGIKRQREGGDDDGADDRSLKRAASEPSNVVSGYSEGAEVDAKPVEPAANKPTDEEWPAYVIDTKEKICDCPAWRLRCKDEYGAKSASRAVQSWEDRGNPAHKRMQFIECDNRHLIPVSLKFVSKGTVRATPLDPKLHKHEKTVDVVEVRQIRAEYFKTTCTKHKRWAESLRKFACASFRRLQQHESA